MNESIVFPEEKIPVIVALIRRGLKAETDREVRRQMERQCKELERYYERMTER